MFLFRLQAKYALVAASLVLVLLVCATTVFTVIRAHQVDAKSGPNAAHTVPTSGTFHGCPAQGNGGDTELNLLKNRTDTGNWQSISWNQLATYPYPKSALHQDMRSWSAADAAQIGRYNGRTVAVTGYLAGARTGHPEPVNCNSTQDLDYHLALVTSPTATEAASIVTEVTPRVRAKHGGWTLARLQLVASRHLPVRISGWTLFDPENDGPRVGPWEIHPIMQIMVQLNGAWVSLDSAKL